MKNIKILAIVIVLFNILISYSAYSQSNTTYDFLNLDAGARPASLGGSFSSNTNDVLSIFYNPAALSTLKKTQASVGFFKYLLDINSGNIAYGQKYKNSGYFGGGIRYINYGSFEKFDEQSNNLGTFSSNEIAVSIGYSNLLNDRLHYGVNTKFIYSGIDEFSSTALAFDLGVLYLIPSTQWNFGISLLNAGFQLSEYGNTSEDLPIDLRIAVSKKLEHLPLNIHFEFDNLTAFEENFFDRLGNLSVGGEFDFSEYVRFRIGYDNKERQDLKTGSSLGIAGFSLGLGLKFLENYSFDYSFNSLGNVGSTHSLNLGYDWK
ncbi:MAG TPA: type IX secretion system protein PorQ [Ignavibacteria bacterium]|nr:type IX secretion system protein PorQ [Ignavibacteria bacterium]